MTETTYHIAMLDRAGKTLAERLVVASERVAKAVYRQEVRIFNSAGFSDEVAAVALIRSDDAGDEIVNTTTPAPVRYVTCVECEAHIPVSEMEPGGSWCRTCWRERR